MTPPKLIVMFLAGVFAAAGIQTGALHVIIGAMLVAPAYEPLARLSLGLINRSRGVRDGLHDVAAGGGIGGGLLIVLNRRVLTTGIVIALALVPSIALAVLELLDGQPSLAVQALLRWLLDVVFVMVGCAVVFEVKRRTDGRRTTSS